MPNMVTQGVSNYLVPATSSPNAYLIRGTFSATPEIVNFSNISLNGLAFRPSGVIIDNTAGTGPLNILIPEMSFNIVCPAGTSMNMPYPAPMNHTAAITGLGDATVIFVDYPLQPYSSVQAAGTVIPNPLPITATAPLNVNISTPNPVPVSGPATDAQMRATPIPVLISEDLSQQTTTSFASSAAGSTTAGITRVRFLINGTAPASIGGIAGLPANYEIEFYAAPGKTLAPILFNAAGSSIVYWETK